MLLLLPIAAFALIWVILMPMLQQGYPSTHSTHFNLSWGFQYQRQFFSGQFYPRWLEFSNFGFGNATFAFYPPLCMVATLPFRAMGLDLNGSLVGSMGVATLTLGAGLYLYSCRYFSRWIGIGVAGLGMLSPYFLVDVYQRGAIGEVWAITVLPWILWASDRVVRQPGPFWPILALGISYGMLVLSHLPTLLLFTLVWIPFPWIMARPNDLKGAVLRCYGGASLAFCWTAFYLWPAALDQRFIQVDSVNALPDYLPQNRLMIGGLLHLHPQLTDHWFESDLLGPWFLMTAGVLIALIVMSLQRAGWLQSPDPDLSRAAIYWIGGTGVTLLMMTDVLSWIYPLTGVLERIQFSWRWLGVTTVLLPMLLGYGLHLAEKHCQDPIGRQRMVGVGLALLSMGLMAGVAWQGSQVIDRAVFNPEQVGQFVRLAEEKQFPEEPEHRPGDPFLFWHWIFPDGLALVDVPEYRARGVVMPMPPDRVYPLLAWADDDDPSGLQIQQWEFGQRQFLASHSAETPRTAVLRTFYYPGWKVQINGGWTPTEYTELGQIKVTLPPGKNHVSVVYLGTMMDWIGRSMSLLAVGIAIWIWGRWHAQSVMKP